jgi:hypothetical protein
MCDMDYNCYDMQAQWQGFLSWLKDGQNVLVFQAAIAAVSAVFAIVLVIVTAWYVRLTNRLAAANELALQLQFQPRLRFEIAWEKTRTAIISIHNVGTVSIKVIDCLLIFNGNLNVWRHGVFPKPQNSFQVPYNMDELRHTIIASGEAYRYNFEFKEEDFLALGSKDMEYGGFKLHIGCLDTLARFGHHFIHYQGATRYYLASEKTLRQWRSWNVYTLMVRHSFMSSCSSAKIRVVLSSNYFAA